MKQYDPFHILERDGLLTDGFCNRFQRGDRKNVQKVNVQVVGCAELSFWWKKVVEFAEALLYS